MGKKPWYSKTNLLGAIQLAAGTITLFAGSELIQQYPAVVSGLAVASGATVILLRFMTSVPIEW